MKTAVEQLERQILDNWMDILIGKVYIGDLFDQAKEMEKQQIVEHSVKLTKILISNPFETSGKTPKEIVDNYFNKTFKEQKNENTK